MSIWTKAFWKDSTERVLFTAVEVFLGLLTADGVDLINLNWEVTGTVVATASLVAFLKSLVANKTVDNTISPASLAR